MHFVCPTVTRETRDMFERALYEHQRTDLPLTLLFGHAHEALAAADLALVASGTATLETALFKTPMVIAYRQSPLTWAHDARAWSTCRTSACRTSSPARSWCPSCCRTTPRPAALAGGAARRCCATARRSAARSSASASSTTCCGRTRAETRRRRGARGRWTERASCWSAASTRRAAGPLAGPVYAAAVILDPARRINGLADSKVLTAERREVLAGAHQGARHRLGGGARERRGDRPHQHPARVAARHAARGRGARASRRRRPGSTATAARDLPCAARAIVDGDATHKPISAASILAKTARDAEMCALHDRYPAVRLRPAQGLRHARAPRRARPRRARARSTGAASARSACSSRGTCSHLAETLRIRGYRLYCEALKISDTAKELAQLDLLARRLKRQYADVFASREPLRTWTW